MLSASHGRFSVGEREAAAAAAAATAVVPKVSVSADVSICLCAAAHTMKEFLNALRTLCAKLRKKIATILLHAIHMSLRRHVHVRRSFVVPYASFMSWGFLASTFIARQKSSFSNIHTAGTHSTRAHATI